LNKVLTYLLTRNPKVSSTRQLYGNAVSLLQMRLILPAYSLLLLLPDIVN